MVKLHPNTNQRGKEIMEKGVSKYWTPGNEIKYEEHLKQCRNFAERHLTMLSRDLLKYDGRSNAAKRARAQARLRIASASDKDLEELAKLEARMHKERLGEIPGLAMASLAAQRLRELLQERAEIRNDGIRKEQLTCR